MITDPRRLLTAVDEPQRHLLFDRIREFTPAHPPTASHGGTDFYPLPGALWRSADDVLPDGRVIGCCCAYCSNEPNRSAAGVGFWDTLAVSGSRRWTVHYPELHGAARLRTP